MVPLFRNIAKARDLSKTRREAATRMTMCWAAILQTVLYRPAQLSRERLTRALADMVIKLL